MSVFGFFCYIIIAFFSSYSLHPSLPLLATTSGERCLLDFNDNNNNNDDDIIFDYKRIYSNDNNMKFWWFKDDDIVEMETEK